MVYPTAKRLTEAGAAGYLAFDLLQLCALLFLTGGVENPFSLLILVPVTVSATILTLRATILLSLLAFIFAGLLTLYHYPLPWADSTAMQLPVTYQWGTFIALPLGTLF